MKSVFMVQAVAVLMSVNSMAAQSEQHSSQQTSSSSADKMSIDFLTIGFQDYVSPTIIEETVESKNEHDLLMQHEDQDDANGHTTQSGVIVGDDDACRIVIKPEDLTLVDAHAYKRKLRSFVKKEEAIKPDVDELSILKPIERRFKKEKLERKSDCVTKKRYRCPTCKTKFSFSSNLARHKREQHKPASNKCSYCDKSFKRKESYLRHLNTHKENPDRKLYRCTQCRKKFLGKRQLRAHRQSKH